MNFYSCKYGSYEEQSRGCSNKTALLPKEDWKALKKKSYNSADSI